MKLYMFQVRRREDVFYYLWRAHNLVNARLKGRETEDPQFPKYQFPPRFLCPNCRAGNGTGADFDEVAVKEFLLGFYSQIRPIGGGAAQHDENGNKTVEETTITKIEEEKADEENSAE